jgi:hypothetical protein
MEYGKLMKLITNTVCSVDICAVSPLGYIIMKYRRGEEHGWIKNSFKIKA